jgi:hypothetical protein
MAKLEEFCCGLPMADFRTSPTDDEHFYCRQCGAHYYQDRWWTKDEWFYYVNEMTYEEWQRQERDAREAELLEDSAHAHEQINHSDPEE